jgi:hypothetical protein
VEPVTYVLGQLVTPADLNALLGGSIVTGMIIPYPGVVVPTGFLACDEGDYSRATYPGLFAALVASKGTATVTIASPGVVTLNSHGLVANDRVYFETTGALPTGLAANTTYWVLSTGLTTNTFRLSATQGGTAINTSGTQSGTHNLYWAPWGVGNSTTFRTPGLNGRGLVGKGTHADVLAIGQVEAGSLAAASRTPVHNSSNAGQGVTGTFVTGGGSVVVPLNGNAATGVGFTVGSPGTFSVGSYTTGSPSLSGSIGPGGTRPTDSGAYAVVPHIIKT